MLCNSLFLSRVWYSSMIQRLCYVRHSDMKRTEVNVVEAGGTIVVAPFDIQVGRCVVVGDPWGTPLVLLDTSKGLLVTDADGNVTGDAP